MKTGEAAKALGLDITTVRKWLDHPLLSPYFSQSARGKHGLAHRLLSEEDVLVLNTVRHLRTSQNAGWDTIAAYLESGAREQAFPQNAISADPRLIPLPQAKQAAEVMAMKAELDASIQRQQELEGEVERLRQEVRQLQDNRVKEISEREREIGRLSAQVEMLREMLKDTTNKKME